MARDAIQPTRIVQAWRCHALAALGLTLLLATSGCAIGSRGPVARGVIHARQLSQRGLDALHNGRVDEAERHFSEAIDHCPTNATARYQLANCLWQRGERNEAITRLSEAIDMTGGQDPEMMIELAYMQANEGQLEAAMKLSDRVVREAPDNPRAWQLRGEILKESDQLKPALASLQRALALAPENAHVQLATAEIYQDLKRPQRVLATLNHLEDQHSGEVQPEYLAIMKADALEALGRNQEAYVVLADANRRNPLSQGGLRRLARLEPPYNRQQTIKRARRQADSTQQASRRQPGGRR